MYWISRSIHSLRAFRRQLLTFLAVLGPGIIVMVADNDAGGISTYAVTGSKYGFSLLWMFLILVCAHGLLSEGGDGGARCSPSFGPAARIPVACPASTSSSGRSGFSRGSPICGNSFWPPTKRAVRAALRVDNPRCLLGAPRPGSPSFALVRP